MAGLCEGDNKPSGSLKAIYPYIPRAPLYGLIVEVRQVDWVARESDADRWAILPQLLIEPGRVRIRVA
ncbi:hypothetical protein ANN_04619 [Periplaneta americana]|uniref:Uncharacterized protein n=1 Tax=Periplaneta americana TaxID=6978 RepID=A0ABQ8TA48_PERAM|nr:hypothetical protein ANN_04619 [Periplaneta americana]